MSVVKVAEKREREIKWLTKDGKFPPDTPRAATWRMVLLPVPAPEVSEGGIYMPDVSKDAHLYSCYVGQIVSMGPLCYTHPRYKGYPPDQQPKLGDFVIYSKHVPLRIETINGVQFVIMNDEHVQSVVDDPRRYRVYV